MTTTQQRPTTLAMQARARARSKARAALAMSVIAEEPSPSEPSVPSVPSLENVPFAIPVSIVPSDPIPSRDCGSLRSRPAPTWIENRRPTTPASPDATSSTSTRRAVRSTRSRPVPTWNENSPASAPKTTSSAPANNRQRGLSVRSRPVPTWNSNDPTSSPDPVSVPPNKRMSRSVRSRPVPNWNSDTASSSESDSTPSTTWKPRSVKTRPASSPTSRLLRPMPRSKSSTTLASASSTPDTQEAPQVTVSGPQVLDRRRSQPRRASNPPPRVTRRMPRSKSSTTLESISSTAAKQPRSRRQIPSRTCGTSRPRSSSSTASMSSSDESQETNPISSTRAAPSAEYDQRPRSSSSSAAIPSAAIKGPSTAEPSLRVRTYEGKFQNRRGQSLFYYSVFPPEKMALRGIVLSLHGIGDHCRRNTEFYERLCKEGFGVISYDLLNHGASDYDQYNTRAHIGNFSHLVDDTNDFITFAKRSIYTTALRYWRKHHHPRHPHGRSKSRVSQPELPLIISGTSYGSLVGLHTVLSGQHKFHAGVWGSPTIGVTWTPLLWAQSKLARPLVRIFPTAKVVPAVQHNLICRDPDFLTKFKADPLTSLDMMTTSSGHESLQAMTRLQQDPKVPDSESAFCAVPMLFLAGSADGVSDQQASIKFFASMGNTDKEFKLFDGLYHKVYEEPEKEDVLNYLAQWLLRRFPLETRHPNGTPMEALKKLEGTAMKGVPTVRAPRTEL